MTSNVVSILAELEGWAGLDLENPAYELLRNMEEQDALAHAQQFEAAFNAGAGEYVLRWMVQHYILPAVVTADATQFKAGIRQGELNVVAGILATMEFSRNGGRR